MSGEWTGPLVPALTRGLADAAARAAGAIAAELPRDVELAAREGGFAISGRALRFRAQTDARLRDFVGIVRAGR